MFPTPLLKLPEENYFKLHLVFIFLRYHFVYRNTTKGCVLEVGKDDNPKITVREEAWGQILGPL